MPPKNTFRSNSMHMNVLHNQFVLYFVFLISLSNFYMCLVSEDMFSVSAFVLSGFLTSFFSKNMIVVLCVAVAATNILKYGARVIVSEGFEESSPDAKSADGPAAVASEDTADIKKKYKELLDLQKQIVDGVKHVYEPLQKAEAIVANMKESMDTMNKEKEKTNNPAPK